MRAGPSSSPEVSLPEAYRSVSVKERGWLRRFLAFAGPGYLVSVGYMDPGNWATALQGGSTYGYALLWVVLCSSLMAMVLQVLCARLGIATGKDLAQACRDYVKRPAAFALWILCEIAIISTDIAEVIGSAVALNLLFGMDLRTGVIVTGLDVLVLLALMRFGFRKIEAIIVTLVATIFVCFAINIFWANPSWGGVATGLVTPSVPDNRALFIAVGILGATVMPHNLYLHSSLVQTRAFDQTAEGKRDAVKNASYDVVLALAGALFVNASILILAAAVFHPAGKIVEDLGDAHTLLVPALGPAAATLFAVALLASGQSSTITGTLAGQIVMEGFLKWRIEPWLRRLITRGLAIIPALILVGGSGGAKTAELITVTQVVLSMQLPFAIFPLVIFTSDRKRMGDLVSPIWLQALAYAICSAITALNVWLLWREYGPVAVLVGAGVMGSFAFWVRFIYRQRVVDGSDSTTQNSDPLPPSASP